MREKRGPTLSSRFPGRIQLQSRGSMRRAIASMQNEPDPSGRIHQFAPIGELTNSEERQLMLRLEELAQAEGLRREIIRAKVPSTTQALIDSKANDSEVLKSDGSVVLEGPLVLKESSADPDGPNEGRSVIWMSDGTGSGDDGDIMVKIAAGGATKTATLIDFSEL